MGHRRTGGREGSGRGARAHIRGEVGRHPVDHGASDHHLLVHDALLYCQDGCVHFRAQRLSRLVPGDTECIGRSQSGSVVGRPELLAPLSRVRASQAMNGILVPKAAVDLAKRFEGFHRVSKNDSGHSYSYLCSAGFWTIGYGHLCRLDHPPITHAEAETYLAVDLQAALGSMLHLCPVLVFGPESRLTAIVDFTFNSWAGPVADVHAGGALTSGIGSPLPANCAAGSTVARKYYRGW